MAGTKADAVKAFVASTPGASYWIEELVIRGRPGAAGGAVAGAHVTFGVEAPNPAGDVTRAIYGPYPLDLLPAGTLKSLLPDLLLSQQSTVDTLNKVVSDRDAEIRQKVAVIASRDATIQQLTVSAAAAVSEVAQKAVIIAGKDVQLQQLEAENQRLLADVERLKTPPESAVKEIDNASTNS
jgi:hypothetical protein